MRDRQRRLRHDAVAGVLLLMAAAAVLGALYDRFWVPADEGYHAHIAERLLDGEVLDRDVEQHHAGYIHLLHAGAFAAAGRSLASLRLPLVLCALLHVLLIWLLMRRRGMAIAAAAALSLLCLGVIQFLNPAAHWYCLLLAIGLACWLTWVPRGAPWRVETAGLLLGLMIGFRQLTGVLAGFGVVAFLLMEQGHATNRRGDAGSRLVIAGLLAALGAYLLTSVDLAGMALFGVWPMLILIWLLRSAPGPVTMLAGTIARLGLGVAIGLAPLVAYHLAHGSIGAWLEDTVIRASGIPGLPFIDQMRFGKLITVGAGRLVAGEGIAGMANGAYLVLLPLLAAANGIMVLRRLVRDRKTDALPGALPVLAAFYALVSLHYQIPVYLYYSAGLSMAGWLWSMAESRRPWARPLAAVVAIFLSGVGLAWHAGQPLQTVWTAGTKPPAPMVRFDAGGRCGLLVPEADRALYARLLEVIEREVPTSGAIAAWPYNPELYFLSRRRNAFPFSSLAVHLRAPRDAEALLAALADAPPALVIHQTRDKYNTPLVESVMAAVRVRYDLLERVGSFEVYRLRAS